MGGWVSGGEGCDVMWKCSRKSQVAIDGGGSARSCQNFQTDAGITAIAMEYAADGLLIFYQDWLMYFWLNSLFHAIYLPQISTNCCFPLFRKSCVVVIDICQD